MAELTTGAKDKRNVGDNLPASAAQVQQGTNSASATSGDTSEASKSNVTPPKRDVLAWEPCMSTTNWLKKCQEETMLQREAPQRLDEVSFEGVAKFIADGKCSNIITMAGAGISTSAGIPDYRTPGIGMFDQLKDKYQVSDASDLFSYEYFMKDPSPFFEKSKQFFEVQLKPTLCHYFLRLLHEKGLLLRHYTQNIDTLERVAGLPPDKVVEAHGSYYTSHCMKCHQSYSFTWIKGKTLADQVPTCEKGSCRGVVKPGPETFNPFTARDIVLYGEELPKHFAETVEQDFPKCDLLIIMGTSLAVVPFSMLISKVHISTPRLYINLEKGQSQNGGVDLSTVFGGGLFFDCEGNLTDVFKKATCDEACVILADLVGWGKELHNLVEREHRRIDQASSRSVLTARKTKVIPKPTKVTSPPTKVESKLTKSPPGQP